MAMADISADAVKSIAVSISIFFRPNASLKKPASAFPPSAPQPRQLTARPSFQSPPLPLKTKYFLMNGTAPEITVASKPSKKPPTATISATETVYSLGLFISRPPHSLFWLYRHRKQRFKDGSGQPFKNR